MSATKPSKPIALIVDDHQVICETLAGVLVDEGWQTISANSASEALELFPRHSFALAFLDVWMEGMDGIALLQKLKELKPGMPLVIMSGHGTIETAVKATKLGAYDFLEKPLSIDKILPILEYAKEVALAAEEKPQQASQGRACELLGVSDAIETIRRQIRVVAPRNSWVFLTGENGTGKEVAARSIHSLSGRAQKPFVAVNCAAIPEELIESELFGYKRGAFTNAFASKMGRFEQAHQGTLFLDEIGDMSMKTQAKILRILQEQTFERLGDEASISVDVRVIAATNKDLQAEIRSGNFREDLYYRLNVVPLHIPPLRERVKDIPLLARYFLDQFAGELGEPVKTLSPDAIKILQEYYWPGNVRQLKNLMERIMILLPQERLEAYDIVALFKEARDTSFLGDLPESEDEFDVLGTVTTLRVAKLNFEKKFILERLEENEWNVSKTADVIGIERSHLHKKLKAFEIETKKLKDLDS